MMLADISSTLAPRYWPRHTFALHDIYAIFHYASPAYDYAIDYIPALTPPPRPRQRHDLHTPPYAAIAMAE